MRRWIGVVVLGLLLSGTAFAVNPRGVRRQVESSLIVTGTIDIDADGRVLGHALEHADALPEGVVAMVGSVVPRWRFEPVELHGTATRARAPMSLRIVAKQLDGDRFTVQIRGAHFGASAPGETVTSHELAPPLYPEAAMRAGVGGMVYVVVRIGRDGRVEEAVAEQVNLRVVTSEPAMRQWRTLLAQAALRAARDWTFNPPRTGDQADAPHWSARIPVDFISADETPAAAHEWQAYVPGPREAIPWYPAASAAGADALAAGGVYPLDPGLHLLTPLGDD